MDGGMMRERTFYRLYMEAVKRFPRAGGVYAHGAGVRLCRNLLHCLHGHTVYARRGPGGRMEMMALWWLTDAQGFAESLKHGTTERRGKGDYLFVADLFNLGGRDNIFRLRAHLKRKYGIIRVGWRSHNERIKTWAAVATR